MKQTRLVRKALVLLAAALVGAGVGMTGPTAVEAANCSGTSTGLVAIPDLGTGTYLGQQGGLYPGGINTPPSAYAATGVKAANTITPRDPQGRPDPNGKIALLSMGMSNTLIEFSAFMAQERADAQRDPKIVLVNGAQGGQDASRWVDPNAPVWSHLESQLSAAGVTDAQVQAIWLLQAQASPTSDFDTYRRSLADQMSAIVRDAAIRFPNLQQVFVSPRIYGGYATTRLNPEPYAYQSGFADKLLVAQSVAHPEQRPWIGWGPYLWADGTRSGSDGLSWTCADLRSTDGTHPSDQGAAKVAQLLQRFFDSSQFTTWFRAAGSAPANPRQSAQQGWPGWLGWLGLAAALSMLTVAIVMRVRGRRATSLPLPPGPGRSD